ncbi:MAG: proline racemase family protein [Verrucomicrobiota bacterium]
MSDAFPTLQVIDSHTGGEPTRVVVGGAPALSGDLATQRDQLRDSFDWIRSAVINEPRGSDAMVGALPVEPTDPGAMCGVIFFNNVGYLHMCVHGTIGLVVTLAHQGKITPGEHLIETPVGHVTATLHDEARVTVANVPSYRYRAAVPVELPGFGQIRGDIAWGGNWFFLIDEHPLTIGYAGIEALTEFTCAVRDALAAQGITGENGMEIDHIEVFSSDSSIEADSRNFVLCPGKAYDRSPCGTGTSAKLACLHAAGKLKPGETWRQASVIGSEFSGEVTFEGEDLIPRVTGTAYVNGESTLWLNPADPFRHGITPATVA